MKIDFDFTKMTHELLCEEITRRGGNPHGEIHECCFFGNRTVDYIESDWNAVKPARSEEYRHQLDGTFVDRTRNCYAAADGSRLAVAHGCVDMDSVKEDMILGSLKGRQATALRSALNSFGTFDKVKEFAKSSDYFSNICIDIEKLVYFEGEYCTSIDGLYPNYTKVIPDVDSESTRYRKIGIVDNDMRIKSYYTELLYKKLKKQGTYFIYEFDDRKLRFNPEFIADAMKVIPNGGEIYFFEEVNPVVFRGMNREYILMPIGK